MCASHLSAYVEKRIGNNMRNYKMIKGRRRIGIAVSGGKDSQVMMHAMRKLIGKDRRRELIAITVDEGIRGYRDKSIECVVKYAELLGIEHHIFSFNDFAVQMDALMNKGRTDPCSYCGVFRRWILNKASRELSLDALAIGHNLDDVVQTLQLNIMRNEPLRIARFTPNGGVFNDRMFVPRIRPMFNIPEKEIIVYALIKSIPFHNGECPYAGHALRNPVREFINDMESKYPGIKFRMLNSYLSLLNHLNFPALRDNSILRCSSCGEPSSSKICKRCSFLNSAISHS